MRKSLAKILEGSRKILSSYKNRNTNNLKENIIKKKLTFLPQDHYSQFESASISIFHTTNNIETFEYYVSERTVRTKLTQNLISLLLIGSI